MTNDNYPDNRLIFKRVLLNPEKHYISDTERKNVKQELQKYSPYKLEIMNYSGKNEDEFYLVSMDKNNEDITDTWHETLEDAIRQAQIQFNVHPDEWLDCIKK